MNVEWNDNADNFCARSAIETHRLINTKQYQQIPLEAYGEADRSTEGR